MASKVNLSKAEHLAEEDAEDNEFREENSVSREQEVEKDINAEETKQAKHKEKHPEQQEGTKQEKPWSEGPFIIMLAVGSIEDFPEALKKIEEAIKIHSGRRSVGVPDREVVQIQNEENRASESEEASKIHSAKRSVVKPVQSEEEQASKIVAKEILGTSEKVKDLLLDSSTKEERRRLADAVIEFMNTIYSDVITEDMPSTQALAQAFDSALDVLISVPVAEQNPAQLIVTFLQLAVFFMTVINLVKQCLENPSMIRIAWTVLTVGKVMFKVADKYGLYEWIRNNGGISGLRVRICDYIRQLRSGNAVTDGNNAVVPWPSNKSIIFLGTLTVFVVSYTYYICKYR